jgi:hypothetical protein
LALTVVFLCETGFSSMKHPTKQLDGSPAIMSA